MGEEKSDGTFEKHTVTTVWQCDRVGSPKATVVGGPTVLVHDTHRHEVSRLLPSGPSSHGLFVASSAEKLLRAGIDNHKLCVCARCACWGCIRCAYMAQECRRGARPHFRARDSRFVVRVCRGRHRPRACARDVDPWLVELVKK